MEDIEPAVVPDPQTEPTISVQRAAQVIGVSRGLAYEGVRRGEIPSIRIGHRLLVPTAALLRLVGVEQSRSVNTAGAVSADVRDPGEALP